MRVMRVMRVMMGRKLAIAAGIVLAAVAFAPSAARAQTPERESVSHEAAGDDIRKDGPGKSPTQNAHGGGHEHGDPSKHFRFFGSPFGHADKDVVGGPFGDGSNFDPKTGESAPGEEESMSAPFIFMILNFVVLLALLSKFGRPAARKLAADRHDQIKTALDEAAKLRQQAAAKLAEYKGKLEAADAEIAELVAGMRADAEADRIRIREAAERQAAQMKHDAEQRIAAEIETARAALTREVTAAATAATEKLLREKMTAADQQKLVGTFIGDLHGVARKEAR